MQLVVSQATTRHDDTSYDTLCNKRDFRDRVTGSVLSWEDDFGLSRWARANHESLKVKEGKKEGKMASGGLRLRGWF